MNEEDRNALNSKINSNYGIDILAEYADSILHTSSSRVRMAIALLFCDDSDFDFAEHEKRVFISAVREMADHMIDFFLALSKLQPLQEDLPYRHYSINSDNYTSLKLDRIDAEMVFVYINDLMVRRFLLPDILPARFSSDQGWSIIFGMSDKTVRMMSLLRKADQLVD